MALQSSKIPHSQLFLIFKRALNDPNVVRFMGIHTSPLNEKYIVTEFMYNGALSTFLQGRDGQFTSEELIDLYK